MMRIGHSTDMHRLRTGERLNIGGVSIPSPYESVGHSDADCLLHAISEALLGSLALGDLGSHFPDTDEANRNLDSKKILQFVRDMIKSKHYQINNIDSMIFLEKPKLNTYIEKIRETIAQLLDISLDRISVKATTGEKRGLIGTSQMIVCEAVVLVTKRSDEDARNKPWKL